MRPLRDLTDPRLIVAKGLLFVALGVLASAALLMHAVAGTGGAVTLVLLHALGVWAFCRAYYFAFYVIEKYVDPGFRFAGLWSAARWIVHSGVLRRRG